MISEGLEIQVRRTLMESHCFRAFVAEPVAPLDFGRPPDQRRCTPRPDILIHENHENSCYLELAGEKWEFLKFELARYWS